MIINNKEVDFSTVQIDGVDSSDYPDFCDAYLCNAYFKDGTELSVDELEKLEKCYPEIAQEMALDYCAGRADYNPYDD